MTEIGDPTPLCPETTGDDRLSNLGAGARRLFDYWCSIRGDRLVPLKRDFDAMQVHSLLGNIWVYEFDKDKRDFVCRLAGEAIHAAWGRRVKGLTYREILGEDAHPAALTRWLHLLETPAVQHSSRGDLDSSAVFRVAERIVLPLAAEDQPDQLLGYSRYELGHDRLAIQPFRWDDSLTVDCADI